MKLNIPVLLVTLSIAVALAAGNACTADTVVLTPSENHHIAQLNSNQPYVAGYHVDAPDLYTRERVDATAITVSFPSVDVSRFPPDSWLGVGMFVQGQDSELGFVDYGYYTMLVIDSLGNLFVDIGLHQTREATAPLHMPTEELVYAYTWQLSGIDPTMPVTLAAVWDSDWYLHYSFSIASLNTTLLSVKVASLPNCESVISKFYVGTVVAGGGFPLGHYVYYFQFGVISNRIIADSGWAAYLKEPRMLRKAGWDLVETAYTIQGDIAYLDQDWMWGGAVYDGVYAEFHQSSLSNPYEVIFSYIGRTLPSGTILWDTGKTGDIMMIPPAVLKQPLSLESAIVVSLEVVTLSGVTAAAIYNKLRKRHEKAKGRGDSSR